MKANYHSHTPRCMHARGSEEEYVCAAIKGGFSVLGFSDHTPFRYTTDFVSDMRMHASELPDYIAKVREAGERHSEQIRVLCGLECEYFPELHGWLREQKEARGLDYLILGNHFDGTDDLNIPGGGFYYGISTTPQELRSYAKMTVRGMETGDFLYLAHPDVVLSQYRGFDGHVRDMARELCRASKALHVPLEYNLLGRMDRNSGRFRGLGYPCDRFWEIAAEEGAECIIGVDAHRPEHLLRADVYDEAVRYLDGLGLKRLEQIV